MDIDLVQAESVIFAIVGAVPFLGRYAYKVVRVARALQVPFRQAVRGVSRTFEEVKGAWDHEASAEEIASLRAEKETLENELRRTIEVSEAEIAKLKHPSRKPVKKAKAVAKKADS